MYHARLSRRQSIYFNYCFPLCEDAVAPIRDRRWLEPHLKTSPQDGMTPHDNPARTASAPGIPSLVCPIPSWPPFWFANYPHGTRSNLPDITLAPSLVYPILSWVAPILVCPMPPGIPFISFARCPHGLLSGLPETLERAVNVLAAPT